MPRALAWLVGVLAALGCDGGGGGEDFVGGEDLVPPRGTLVQLWTIEGATDASRCSLFGAARMRVVVFDPEGNSRASELSPCESFLARVVLRPGVYDATATFLDPAGVPVSVTRQVPRFTIEDDFETPRSIDFTAEDFAAL